MATFAAIRARAGTETSSRTALPMTDPLRPHLTAAELAQHGPFLRAQLAAKAK
jgi:hypothetical protein